MSMAVDKSNKSLSFARWQQGGGFAVPRATACLKTEMILLMSARYRMSFLSTGINIP